MKILSFQADFFIINCKLGHPHHLQYCGGKASNNRIAIPFNPYSYILHCTCIYLLYSIFTFDCKASLPGSLNTLIVNFADDITVTGFISSDESNYRKEVESVVNWCNSNTLHLNDAKTKALLIDFRKGSPSQSPLEINNVTVERIQSFKFLRTY